MATVILDFLPPTDPDITTLHVEEAPSPDGVFTELATHPAGTYPGYISKVTITDATSVDHWFRIAWENASGGMSPWSDPFPGNSSTYLSKLIDRVMLRMPNANENVVAQESEAVIEQILHVDPYTSAETVKYNTWSAMTLLVMARTQLSNYAAGASSSDSFTAGLVSMKSSTGTALDPKGIQALIAEAGRLLGISTARVAQMVVPEIAGGLSEIVMADISRLQIDVA